MSVDVLRAAGGRTDALALITPKRSWTFGQLDAAVDERAQGFRDEGVGAGRVVPSVIETDVAGILFLLALWRVGAVPAPLNPRLTDAERERAIAALTDAPSGAQAVVWTSGTAGRPRGVALSYENLAASARAAADRLELSEEDVWLASLSLAHVGGLALLTRSLLLGGRLVVNGSFDVGTASDFGRELVKLGSLRRHAWDSGALCRANVAAIARRKAARIFSRNSAESSRLSATEAVSISVNSSPHQFLRGLFSLIRPAR